MLEYPILTLIWGFYYYNLRNGFIFSYNFYFLRFIFLCYCVLCEIIIKNVHQKLSHRNYITWFFSVPPYSYQLYQPGYINPQFFYAQRYCYIHIYLFLYNFLKNSLHFSNFSGINQPKNDMGPDGNQK